MTTTTATDPLGEHLTRQWVKRGEPSFRSIARYVATQLGPHAPGDETIRNYHLGRTKSTRADLPLLKVLARYYDCKVEDFGPVIAERWGYFEALDQPESATDRLLPELAFAHAA